MADKRIGKRVKNSEANVPNTGSLVGAIAKVLRKRKKNKSQKALENMRAPDAGGRSDSARRPNNYEMGPPNPRGGRNQYEMGSGKKSADGIATSGKTRLSMKGYGKKG